MTSTILNLKKVAGKRKRGALGSERVLGQFYFHFFKIVFEISAIVEGAKLSSTKDSPGSGRVKGEGDLLDSTGP